MYSDYFGGRVGRHYKDFSLPFWVGFEEICITYLNTAPSVDDRSAECDCSVVIAGDGSWRSKEVSLGHTQITVSLWSDDSAGTWRMVFHHKILQKLPLGRFLY